MGIRVIGQKKFEVTETELLQQDLLFYIDNPRVYSVLHENGHDNPTQTEIERALLSCGYTRGLILSHAPDYGAWRKFNRGAGKKNCYFFVPYEIYSAR